MKGEKMEPFELKVNSNTIYIKIIRFIGTLMLGFFIGAVLFKYRYEGTIDWINSFTGVTLSLVFAFYPDTAGKKILIIDDKGICLKNYSFLSGKKEYDWASVKAIEVKKNRIELTKGIGSTERIQLPIYTDDQMKNLKNYLQQLTSSKEITYKQ